MCCRAYNIVRRHGAMLLNLLGLMLPSGIPELQVWCRIL